MPGAVSVKGQIIPLVGGQGKHWKDPQCKRSEEKVTTHVRESTCHGVSYKVRK